MFIKLLKSKLHQAKVTATKLHYSGSVAIDRDLMDAAGLMRYEAVLIADLNNGNRVETYVVPAQVGSGKVEILGAAARLINLGDQVIVMAFGYYTPEEAAKHRPKVLILDDNNKIAKQLA
jgi:aspartate 1-decarboxylase